MIHIVENFFDDVDSIVEFALQQKFYSKSEHPIVGGHWKGYRTLPLFELDNSLEQKIVSILFDKIKIRYNNYSMYFHCILENNVDESNWFHQDNDVEFAGVVYLNNQNCNMFGTNVMIQEKQFHIDNVYNRGVFYDSKIWHKPSGGFGTDMQNSRLTLNIFMSD